MDYILIEGIVDPSLEQLRKTKAYLSHIFVRHSAFILGSLLTDRGIEILHKLSCGERAIDIAVSFGVSRTRIAQLLNSIFKKLWANNDTEAVYIATRLGYLPFKRRTLSQIFETVEIEDASVQET